MLNLVESGEDSTIREKELTYKNFVGKAYYFETFHCLLCSVPPAGFIWIIKSPKILCVGLLFVFINLSWWLQVGHHPIRRSGVPAQSSSHSLSYQCPNCHTYPFTHYFLFGSLPYVWGCTLFPYQSWLRISHFYHVFPLSRQVVPDQYHCLVNMPGT